MTVSHRGEALNVEYRQRGICDRLSEDEAGVLVKLSLDLLVAHILGDESDLDAETLQRHREKVNRAAVYRGEADEILSRGCDVKDRDSACRLTGRRAHSADAAFESGDLILDVLYRRVGDARIHMACNFEVEKVAEIFGRLEFVRRTLINGKDPRF